MKTELLPIGSVVRLKNANHDLCIIGYAVISENVMYDYIGFAYPEGFVSNEKNFIFNHEDIETTKYVGEENDDFYEAKKNILEVLNSQRGGNNE